MQVIKMTFFSMIIMPLIMEDYSPIRRNVKFCIGFVNILSCYNPSVRCDEEFSLQRFGA